MIIRSDHLAGATVVALGLLVIALSGDLPVGNLSMPGAGFLPMLVAVLIIILGAALFFRARESRSYSELGWDDGKHAVAVIGIAAAAAALYITLGFVVTMILMMVALLVLVERRNAIRAAIYSIGVVMVTYVVFVYVLRSPMPDGLLGH